ncbi:MAG: mRNA surveillance protein pelota [Candidatus Nanoarchaeia archaeon]|jgi:protein pelota
MQTIYKDLKKGLIKLRINDNEDLWTIRKIINPGDLISGETTRVIKKEDREGKRKNVFIKLKAEKVELMDSAFVLKVLGPIIEGPIDVPAASYHSFNLSPGDVIIIEKNWGTYELNELKKSERKSTRLLAVIIDSHESTHALITNEVKELFNHSARLPRKEMPDYDKKVTDFYKETIKQTIESFNNHQAERVIIAGPGFAPEELFKLIKDKLPASKAHCNNTGMAGVKELINQGIIKEIVKESEISEETMIVEAFFKQVGKGKKVAYGMENVGKAVNNRAIETLIISEGLIIDSRERKTFKEIEQIINTADENKSIIEFVGTKHDAGKRFYKFGGIGAILRFEL